MIGALVLVAAASAAAMSMADETPEPAPEPVMADAPTARRLAIATVPARAVSHAAGATAFARVLDPIPLAQLDADIAAAAPAAAASRAEAARSRSLFAADATVSRKVAEAATMQSGADDARLMLLRRRLGLEWGSGIARLSDGQRGALVAALASGGAALVRIDSAGGAGQAALRRATLDLGPLGSVVATVLGPARAADPRLQSPGLIARVSGPNARLLATGLSLPAWIEGAAQTAVLVPARAVLRVEKASWVYVQAASGRFERRRLAGTTAAPDGIVATGGVRPGERIVTEGAAALWAAEQGEAHEGEAEE